MAVDYAMPVLVVDDYNTMVRIIRNLLRQLGFESIDDASDGTAARGIAALAATAGIVDEDIDATERIGRGFGDRIGIRIAGEIADGGQRIVTRFGLQPRQAETWLVSVNRHGNIDRPGPR